MVEEEMLDLSELCSEHIRKTMENFSRLTKCL